MIKAIIFDLNGVFIKSRNLSERFEEKFGVPEEKFISALKDIMLKVRLPKAGDSFFYWKPYLKEWKTDLTRDEFFNFWFRGEKQAREMIELAKQIKNKGLKIFVLSNNFFERANYYKQNFPFLEKIFDKVYYSFETGFVKLNPEAYKKLLTDNNLQPEECIYFDDSKENIKTAKNLGIKSFLFEDADKTKKILETYNL